MVERFFEAWWFLVNHRIFQDEDMLGHFSECLVIEVVKVNPLTEEVEDEESLKTATRVWLECGPWNTPEDLDEKERASFPDGIASHDPDLDCGAPTLEMAVIRLASLVKDKYGSFSHSRRSRGKKTGRIEEIHIPATKVPDLEPDIERKDDNNAPEEGS